MLFLVTLSTMPSIHRLLEVACPLAAFGGSMRPWPFLLLVSTLCKSINSRHFACIGCLICAWTTEKMIVSVNTLANSVFYRENSYKNTWYLLPCWTGAGHLQHSQGNVPSRWDRGAWQVAKNKAGGQFKANCAGSNFKGKEHLDTSV